MTHQFEQVKEIMNMFEKSQMTSLKLKTSGLSLKLSKNKPQNDSPSKETIPIILPETLEEPITLIPQEKNLLEPGEIVRSPIVGTFYESAAPDKPPFVQKGSSISAGNVLCIIEAMKVMNEITSKVDGSIAEIYVQNEQIVEYGQPLFRITK